MPAISYTIVLSDKDEGVPKDYIGIYSLFTEEKYKLPTVSKEAWSIGFKRLKEMRRETFLEVKKRFKICQSDDYAKFWNGNLDAINEIGINKFASVIHFKELAFAMICFEKTVQNKTNSQKRKVVSWGIKKSIYRAYYKSHLESEKTGNPPKKVSLYDQNKKHLGNIFKQSEHSVTFYVNGRKRTLKIDKNAVFEQFEHWCNLKGLGRKEGFYRAMMLLMAEEPIEELREAGCYERKTDLDYCEILVPDVFAHNKVGVNCKIPKKTHEKMKQIIQRFNIDPENAGKPTMTIEKYIIQAVELLNRKSPLKYSDPQMYENYMRAKQAEEYNKIALGK